MSSFNFEKSNIYLASDIYLVYWKSIYSPNEIKLEKCCSTKEKALQYIDEQIENGFSKTSYYISSMPLD